MWIKLPCWRATAVDICSFRFGRHRLTATFCCASPSANCYFKTPSSSARHLVSQDVALKCDPWLQAHIPQYMRLIASKRIPTVNSSDATVANFSVQLWTKTPAPIVCIHACAKMPPCSSRQVSGSRGSEGALPSITLNSMPLSDILLKKCNKSSKHAIFRNGCVKPN